MPLDKRMRISLAASLLINIGAIAWLGHNAVWNARAATPPPTVADLHPVPVTIAEVAKAQGEKTETGMTGDDSFAGGPADSAGSQESGHVADAGDGMGAADATVRRRASGTAGLRQNDTVEGHAEPNVSRNLNHTALGHEGPASRPGQSPNAAEGRSDRPSMSNTAPRSLNGNIRSIIPPEVAATSAVAHGQDETESGPAGPHRESQNDLNSSVKSVGLGGADGSQAAASNSDPLTHIVRRPQFGKVSHVGDRANSIAPKRIKYPKMKVNLGTVHMTRPKHGVVGGGSSDLRDVEITAHYVIDDPKNVPKHLQPDHVLKVYAGRCTGDPGNTSKCLPTGGNTILGGTTLHGKHDHITGTKYCVPGGGGYGAPPVATQYPSSTQRQTTTTELHLPAGHGDYGRQIPGAKAPMADRRWVYDPKAHQDEAEVGPLATTAPKFTLVSNSIGTLSKMGTVEWKEPRPVKHRKAPLGGDGSGLLGKYYQGNNFDKLVFTRPDRNIDFDWTGKSAGPHLSPTHEYSVRWRGILIPRYSEMYTISAASDDGGCVFLDGVPIISNWTLHPPSEDVTRVYLEAGREYDIRVDYFENGDGAAIAKLYWQSPSQPKEYIPEQCLRYPKER